MTTLTAQIEEARKAGDWAKHADLWEQRRIAEVDAEEESLKPDWYERRNELEPGMVFNSCYGVVKLDRGVPGDGTKWYVQSWYPGIPELAGYENGHWSCDDGTIEPGDLSDRLPDDYAGGEER